MIGERGVKRREHAGCGMSRSGAREYLRDERSPRLTLEPQCVEIMLDDGGHDGNVAQFGGNR